MPSTIKAWPIPSDSTALWLPRSVSTSVTVTLERTPRSASGSLAFSMAGTGHAVTPQGDAKRYLSRSLASQPSWAELTPSPPQTWCRVVVVEVEVVEVVDVEVVVVVVVTVVEVVVLVVEVLVVLVEVLVVVVLVMVVVLVLVVEVLVVEVVVLVILVVEVEVKVEVVFLCAFDVVALPLLCTVSLDVFATDTDSDSFPWGLWEPLTLCSCFL
mmetsp:Transcript_130172/g.353248  ORF Transcript_130172/g.353248 Transcript_130172/m.353248 type:complete len:213 (-) Transcript_130172:180-818(-)